MSPLVSREPSPCLPVAVENPSVALEFETVSIKYWAQERNGDNLFVQPVYYFEGTSTMVNGETEHFTITVQANDYVK